jgi:hypothetical protein
MSNVVPFRRQGWQPTLTDPAPPRLPGHITLTVLEAQLIATLLRTLRSYPPSPVAIDKAIDMLTPREPA